jgi:hypothetical protein
MSKAFIKKIIRRLVWKATKKSVMQVLTPRCKRDGEPEYGRFTPSDIERIIQQANLNVEELLPYLQNLDNIGNYLNVYVSLVDLAIYRTLVREGLSPSYAINLTGDINWQLGVNTSGYFQLKKNLMALKTGEPKDLTGKFLEDMLKFPFGEPGYQVDFYQDNNTYYMNIYSCPVFDFYKQFGKEEMTVCRKVFCTYDYAVAERIGERCRYERKHTLSDGDEVCDMRWSILDTPLT